VRDHRRTVGARKVTLMSHRRYRHRPRSAPLIPGARLPCSPWPGTRPSLEVSRSPSREPRPPRQQTRPAPPRPAPRCRSAPSAWWPRQRALGRRHVPRRRDPRAAL